MFRLGCSKVGVRLGIEPFRFAHRPGVFLPGLAGDGRRLTLGSRRFVRTHAGMFSLGGCEEVYQIHRMRLGLRLVSPFK